MRKKSFVLTGHVERSTCNCGCITNNTFWQDGGFGGSNYLSHLHSGIEKFLDELSEAGPGETGKECDVKVTVTIEELGPHNHRILTRNSFSGLGYEDNIELKKKILEPAVPENAVELNGKDEFGDRTKIRKKMTREISESYLQDIHDRLLLIQRTGNKEKLEELRQSIETALKLA
jgi:hypothetical protein